MNWIVFHDDEVPEEFGKYLKFGHFRRKVETTSYKTWKELKYKACCKKPQFCLTVINNCQFARSWTFSITLSGNHDNTSFWKENTSHIFHCWSQHSTPIQSFHLICKGPRSKCSSVSRLQIEEKKHPKCKIPQNNINLPRVQYLMMQRNQLWTIIVDDNSLPPFHLQPLDFAKLHVLPTKICNSGSA